MEQVLTQSQVYYIHRAFSLTASILNSNNIPFFLTGGTLLGWARCGGMIKYDDDIDIAIHEKYKDVIFNDLKKNFSWLKLKVVKPSALYLKVKWEREEEEGQDIWIDLTFYDDEGYDLRKSKRNRKYDLPSVFPLIPVQFSQLKPNVYIPSNFDEYLRKIFPDWEETAIIYNHKDNKKSKVVMNINEHPELLECLKYHFK
jgi:phosphorylcholine metabolism protein LicD